MSAEIPLVQARAAVALADAAGALRALAGPTLLPRPGASRFHALAAQLQDEVDRLLAVHPTED